jgi:hypothetical protein
MKCPRCHKPLTEQQIKSLWGQYQGSKDRPKAQGKKRPGIGGRPKLPRCPCGTMTATRAAARNHTCEAPQAHA